MTEHYFTNFLHSARFNKSCIMVMAEEKLDFKCSFYQLITQNIGKSEYLLVQNALCPMKNASYIK